MTLKYKCKCGQKHDILINTNEPKTVECLCGRKVYVLLNIFETSKGDHYYKQTDSHTASFKPRQEKDIVRPVSEPEGALDSTTVPIEAYEEG